MKKAYILFASFSIFLALIFCIIFMFNFSSYMPRFIKDYYKYTQAKILLNDSKELSKYFLYLLKNNNKECINNVKFNYPNKDTIISIDYFYPENKCINNKLINKQKTNFIIVKSSVYIKSEYVNEEIYLDKRFFIYLDQE